MLKITSEQAYKLEFLVKRVYGCERYGVMHMADADYLGVNPFYAAILVFVPKYYKHPQKQYADIQDFFDRYEEYFQEIDIKKYDEDIVNEFIDNMEKLIKKHYRCLSKK